MKAIPLLTALTALLLMLHACEDYTENYPVPPPSIVADFSYTSGSEFDPPDTISFENKTYIPDEVTGNVSYLWEFGDNTTSTETNPVHVFTDEGTFNVKLTPVYEGVNRTLPYEEKIKFVAQLKGDTILFQDWEDTNGLVPDDWALFNLDQGTVASGREDFQGMNDSAWINWYSVYFESRIALACSWYDEADLDANDWMITPKVQLGPESIIQWDAMSMTSSGDYRDSYKIWVSTSTQDPDGCMANPLLFRVVDEEAGTDADNPGEGIQSRTASLKAYANQEVYIGFQLMTPYPGGDRIGIDNILIINP